MRLCFCGLFLVIAGTAFGECIGTIQEMAGKLSAPEKVSKDFQDYRMKIHAKGDWKKRDIDEGQSAWNSESTSKEIHYELVGKSGSCVDTATVMTGIVKGDVEGSVTALMTFNLVARAAGLSKEDAGPMSVTLINDLPEGESTIEKRSKGYRASLTVFEGVFVYSIEKEE